MDRRTLIAVALCLVVLIGWPFLLKVAGLERYVRRAPPPATTVDTSGVAAPTPTPTPAATETGRPAAPSAGSPATAAKPGPAATASSPFASPHAEAERLIDLETPLYRATFSNRGARLLAIELKHYASAHPLSATPGERRPHHKPGAELPAGDRVVLAGGPSLGLDLGSDASRRSLDDVVFAASESLDAAGAVRRVTFTATAADGGTIRQTWRVRPDDYALDLEVELRHLPAEWRLSDYTLTARSWPLIHENSWEDEERSLRATSLVGTNLHREPTSALRKGPRRFEGNVEWAAVHTRYFMGAAAVTDGAARSVISSAETRPLTADQRRMRPNANRTEQSVAVNTLVMGLPGETDPVDHFLVYFGPNEYFRVSKLGHHLARVVDLGWSWILPLSKSLLVLLVWLHGVLKNYGLAIILVATLVRVVLHPLNMVSMKSMRAMQRLQPEMERLKAKYKSDPQALNTAVMALYKENKVNPAGGCLPMVLQMPLFLALYAVLYNAIELRQAPFVAWINDLSAPDLLFTVGGLPLRLMPVLMMLSGLITQRLTPTDPRQSSTMYLMNVVMLVFFYNLPSGLVLYWTVMNLLTALQQWMVLHEDGGVAATADAPTVRRGTAVARKAGAK